MIYCDKKINKEIHVFIMCETDDNETFNTLEFFTSTFTSNQKRISQLKTRCYKHLYSKQESLKYLPYHRGAGVNAVNILRCIEYL